MFTKKYLLNVRCLAFRKKVWFRYLDDVERGILSLSAKIFNFVQSSVLDQQLVLIIDKLLNACKSKFIRHLEQYGVERVKEIQSQSTNFGYKGADYLSQDLDFARYLVFLDYYQPIGRKALMRL